MCSSLWVCVYVWLLALLPASSWGGRVIEGIQCKQIFVGISKSYGSSTCSLPFYYPLCRMHVNKRRPQHKHVQPCINTFSLSAGRRLWSRCALPVTLFAPFPGLPLAWVFPRSGQNQFWVSLPSDPKLPGEENRPCCHPCPSLSPCWSRKQTLELPEGSVGGKSWEPAGYLNRVQDKEWRDLASCTSPF